MKRLLCRIFGHRYPPVATWRWSKNARNVFGERGVARQLGARARRREQERGRICTRCGEGKV